MYQAQKYYWIIVLAFLFGFYIRAKPSESQSHPLDSKTIFTPAKLKLGMDSSHLQALLAYSERRAPILFGKSSFSDCIEVKANWYRNYIKSHHYSHLDSIYKYNTGGLQIIPGTQANLSPEFLAPAGDLQLRPLYIVNETSQAKVLMRYAGVLHISIEAKNHAGQWEQISGQRNLGDYAADWQLKIHPGEFAYSLFTIPTGNFSTQVRVKLKNGDNSIVSKPFKANIYYGAFQTFENNW